MRRMGALEFRMSGAAVVALVVVLNEQFPVGFDRITNPPRDLCVFKTELREDWSLAYFFMLSF